jgi:alkanesulfonate monooxygenase SsuD/methylene tetrahydromethanopterin reductase-like flavin-dependent oxidoreductase (luciferase family)
MGGCGRKRTPRVAATYAGEANASGAPTPERARPFFEACSAACEKRGRDPKTLRRSVMLRVCCGEDDADIERQAADAGLTIEAIRASGVFVCRPPELVERLHEWEASGVDRVVLSRRSAVDLPSLRLIGEAVLPHVVKSSSQLHG